MSIPHTYPTIKNLVAFAKAQPPEEMVDLLASDS